MTSTEQQSYIAAQAEGWIDIGRFHHEYDRNPAHLRPETADGPGATLALTENLRVWLADLLKRAKICTMLDAACGDWSWMRLVDLGVTEYTGWDCDPGRVDTCRRRLTDGDFASLDRPNAQFDVKNLLTVDDAELAGYDLVLCRDFLMHVTNEHVAAFLDKVKRGDNTLLLATTFPGADNSARAYDPARATWTGYMEQALDLTAEPFNLPAPIDSFAEEAGPWGILAVPRELALFKIN
jgi:2-polyprenyl-3-methyl-5-hydroxy-6-metoxy-1,4-benzoquinol methylase